MNFTIIYTEDLATGQKLSLDKDGNTYIVSFSENDKYISQRVKTINEAKYLYNTIINYFIHGVYTFEERTKILKKEDIHEI